MHRAVATVAPKEASPAWDVARLYPNQGHWSEGEYLSLTGASNLLVEFTDGHVRVLAMPKLSHQLIAQYLFGVLLAFVGSGGLGTVVMAPYPVRLRKGKFREPDVVFVRAEHADRAGEDYCDGADLVMEVVSPDPESRERDVREKRKEYAQAGIPEYWIVDPEDRRITVLKLSGRGKRAYAVHGAFAPGERAASALLKGFGVDVAAAIAAGARPRKRR